MGLFKKERERIWRDALTDAPKNTEQVIVMTNTGKVKTAYYDASRKWFINLGMPGEKVERWCEQSALSILLDVE
jgi:hypothetical protein